MNNFIQRTITGAGIVLFVSAGILVNAYTFIVLIMIINSLGLLEYYRLFKSDEVCPRKIEGLLFAFILFITASAVASNMIYYDALLINIPLAFLILIFELYRKAVNPIADLAITFLGVLSITVPLIFFAAIAFFPFSNDIYNKNLVLGYFLIVWSNDTAAYVFGQKFGKHPLFKRISPNKTWEGSAAGALFALGIAYLISTFFTAINYIDWMVIATIIIVAGTYGDLLKSLMKRSLKVKDTGNILPGHGGILDRFDSLLGSAPLVFCYLMLFK